ncbi:MAG: winged helix-turn-helix domain-containing protein [Patescibacteria group bacterium]|nr:winged helix-turn-helix domain-containing protein [Patescibacteria group bacterium]
MEHHHLEGLYPHDARYVELEQLLTYIKDGNSAQLIGVPGVGRGNLCKFLVYNHNVRINHLGGDQTRYHFVFTNFAEVKNRPLGDVLKFMFLQLVSSLHERRNEDAFIKTDTMFKKALSYKDELVLFQGLKDAVDYLVHEKDLHIIFLFERFELYIPLLTDNFFVHLRSLRERAKYRFSVVFSLNRPLEDLVEPKILADFYEFFAGHIVYVGLSDKPGIQFRIAYLQQLADKKLTKTQMETLTELTGGHGKLMRLGAEALLASTTTVEKNMEQFLLSQKTIQGALFEIWSFLTPSEQHFLSKKPKETPPEFLIDVGLIIPKGTLAISLLKPFLTKEDSQTDTYKIMYDVTTNTIKKGDINISEKLTAAEFRLLQFFLEHKNTILDRDTIISAVWKDTATTAGVTDQALDQLIFRLRKKLEEDPNNPRYIITVKGRGIKFTL